MFAACLRLFAAIFSMWNVHAFRQLWMKFDTIVKVQSTHSVQCPMKADEGVSLNDYMQLPISQYVLIDMPMSSKLERIGGNDFLLTVPPVTFFDLKCSPEVFCQVEQIGGTKIRITSEKCRLSGSSFIERLNDCFKFKVVTDFTWKDTPIQRTIISNSDIIVYVEPPFPFSAFPKSLLEATGNFVMQVALNEIERSFIESLAKDYYKWVTDSKYRGERGSLQERKEAVDQQLRDQTIHHQQQQQQQGTSPQSRTGTGNELLNNSATASQ